jgi:hypothetical protein
MHVLKLPQIGKPALLAMAAGELSKDSFAAWLLAHIALMKRETGGNWNPTPNSLECMQHKQKERA